MAEADPDSSSDTSDSDLKPITQLFSIPRFFVSKDSDAAGKSPTSPLDFSLFGGLFSPRSPSPSSPRFRNRWACDKVGLSVLSSTVGGEGHDGCSIVLAPQIKPKLFGPCVKSNSLPKNYAVSSDVVNIHHPLPCDDDDATAGEEAHNSPRRSSSSPMDIISSQVYSCSLSGREMALSEDYTCIISHGPNPKTTHIFGDCILDCDPKELGTKEEDIEKPEGDDSFSRVCSFTDKPQNHIHMHSEASAAAAAEKETDKEGVENCLEISPGSSYNEDLFSMVMNAS